MRYIFIQCLALTALTITGISDLMGQERKIDLSGEWCFAIDREDSGMTERWFVRTLDDRIHLPGSMAENRKGDDVTLETKWTASIYDSSFFYNPRLEKFRQPDNLKLPFWLTPVKYYVGPAWYQKEVIVPADWRENRITLFLERPHTETILWINGKEIGMQNSLSVPHVYDVTPFVKTGSNILTLRIDNRTKDIDVGKDSHSITDQTQGNWNGMVGRLELQAMPVTYLEDIQVYPDPVNAKARVKVRVKGNTPGTLTVQAESYNGERTHRPDAVSGVVRTSKGEAFVELELPMGDFLAWDEFHPNLYRLTATLTTDKGTDVKQTRFGMREFTIDGKYFYINGRKTMLRGTVENCVFPLTGYAPMDVDSWVRVFRICRNFGLNHMRFHSFCPPEAAMEAADLVGFYLQPEGPSWPNHGSSLGNGQPVDDYLWEEAKRIVKQYGNYPSFCMFAIGNEPRGRWVAWVSRFVDYWKETDPRRVYTGASVGGSWAWQPRNQFHVKAGARGLDWNRRPESRSDFREKIDTVKQPFVSHETGQWCVFPDFTEIKKYTGVMRARNFELFREDLKDRHMGDLEADFLMASGKLQALCYKHEIERTLRTPGYAGFQLLSLNDYSGQGTALVGLLNAFWEEKGYIDAEEFRKFCAPTVLLARMDKFVFENDEILTADIETSHFGESDWQGAVIGWTVRDAYGKVLEQRKFPAQDIALGACQPLGAVSFALSGLEKAQKINLEVQIQGSDIRNDWDVWVYPKSLPEQANTEIHITDTLDSRAKNILAGGGKVLLLLDGKVEQGKEVVQHMTTSFWNTSWFKMRPPHTEGTLVNNYHPALCDFPTDSWTGLQWWELIQDNQVMELNAFPPGFQAIIQPIDTWFINRKLGMLFEANAGRGKLMVCSADISKNLDKRPVARQLRWSILSYMNSPRFIPEWTLNLTLIEDLSRRAGERLDVNNRDAPDELKNIVL